MQYQMKWVRNMLKLFSLRSSSLMRTFLLAGLILGSLGAAIISLQLSQVDASAAFANSNHVGYAPAVSIRILSHINRRNVIYTLAIRNAARAGTIRKRIPITFTDIVPRGVKNISAQGKYWYTRVHSKAGPSAVTGTYRGSYPVAPGVTLPLVTITGTITHDASKVLTNSASVHVLGNTDRTHSHAVVHNNIASLLSSRSLQNRGNDSNCDNSCSNQTSDACDNACNNQSTSDVCDNACDEQSVHVAVQRSVAISSEEVESVSGSTGCRCGDAPSIDDSSGSGSITPDAPDSPSPRGQGSVIPAMPNTGSDPNSKG
jgi:hypothetical protein